MADTAMHTPTECPRCGVSFDELTDGPEYAPGNAERIVEPLGVEVRGVYDGVLFWRCSNCSYDMHRFDKTSRLHWVAEEYMTRRSQA